MKLLIDTENKVIKIEELVCFGELIEKIKKLLPGEWKEYKLDANSVIQWSNPIIIDRWPVYPVYPSLPYPRWWNQPYYGETTGGTLDDNSITTFETTMTANRNVPVTLTMSKQNQYCIEC